MSIVSYGGIDEVQVFKYAVTKMIEEDKTFRDPIHLDILVNHLETRVIDTETFQRLRRIRQLGTAHLVYHGAEHSRFQHSLGVLYMTSFLMDKIKRNRFSEIRLFSSLDETKRETKEKRDLQDNAFLLITRLAALLHDLTVVPFSHTLEKEGNIFRMQWNDEYVIKSLIGPDSEIYGKIISYTDSLIREKFKDLDEQEYQKYAKLLTNTILMYVLRIIRYSNEDAEKSKTDEFCKKLYGSDIWIDLIDKKFIEVASQIVLNTVCADLLDYLKRDFRFCGINKTYDERFLNYACVMKLERTPIFGYRLIGKKGQLKFSVLSSLIDTLELRYDLAELVHTHHTKNCFSAMVIEAFNFYWQSLSKTQQQTELKYIIKLGDDEFLNYIHSRGGVVTKKLVERYNSRIKYDEALLFQDWPQSEAINKAISLLKDPERRLYVEKCIAGWIKNENLSEGDCLIYVMPEPSTMYKALETYAIYHLDQTTREVKIRRLDDIASLSNEYSASREEQSTAQLIRNRILALKKNYGSIWNTYVFIAQNAIELKKEIMGVIGQMFRLCGIEIDTVDKGDISATLLVKIEELRRKQGRLFTDIKELPLTF
jgi:HD superfamily phosphohydrolase